jgi:hypothetical protein
MEKIPITSADNHSPSDHTSHALAGLILVNTAVLDPYQKADTPMIILQH